MRYRILRQLVLLIAVVAYVAAARPVVAQSADAPLDIVVVIDNSGSMHSKVVKNMVAKSDFGKGSDPTGLRYDATKMLVELLDTNDRLGVVHFSDAAGILGTGQTMLRMDESNRKSIRGELDTISVDYSKPDSRATNKYGTINDPAVPPGDTNYTQAFAGVNTLLQTNSTNRKAVIFLTDGAPTDMGKSAATITTAMQTQLKNIDAPVFLLMLQNPNEKSQPEIAAVKGAFAASNQKVIDIANANDIAHALASVLTYLKPNLYLDVLQGVADSGPDTTVFTPSISADQHVSDVTFVFAPHTSRTDFKVNVNDLTFTNPNPPGARFTTFQKTVAGDINDNWTFTVNAAPADITGFAFVRSTVRMTLRYPDASATTSQIMAYPRDSQHLLGALIQGVQSDAMAYIALEATQSCDAINPAPAAPYPVQRTGLHTGSEPVVWALLPPSNQPLFVNVTMQKNQSLVLRRCYELQPTAQPLTVAITKPVSDTPAASQGQIAVAAKLSAPAEITASKTTLFYGKDDNTPSDQLVMTPKNDEVTATLPLNQGGAHKLSVVVEGLVADRPVVLYKTSLLTPQFQCELQRVGNSDARGLGELTTADPVDLSLQCMTKGDSKPQAIDPQTVLLRDAQNQAVLDMASKLLNFGVVSEKEGLVQWPITLQNIDLLSGGRYTLEIPVQVYGETIPVQYTFVRPAVAIALTWDGYQDAQSVLDMGSLDAGQNALTACVTATIPALAKSATLASAVTVTALSHDSQKVTTDGVTALLQPNDPRCPDGDYALQMTLPATLDAATYTADVVVTSSDAKVPVQPQPLHVQFTTAKLQAELAFVNAVAGTTTPTYRVAGAPAGWLYDSVKADITVPYTVTITGATRMPLLERPRYQTIKAVQNQIDFNGFATVQPYWEGSIPKRQSANVYTGAIVLTNVPRYTWDGGAYDVVVRFDDAQIVSAKEVAFRVQTIAYGNLLIWIAVAMVLVMGVYGWRATQTKKLAQPKTAESQTPPSPAAK